MTFVREKGVVIETDRDTRYLLFASNPLVSY